MMNKKKIILKQKSDDKIRKKIPWVDKYRPKKVKDIIQQDDITKALNDIVTTGNLQHLLLHGPPGTGKTSTILAIANELFGPVRIKERVIELNASDENGINVVRSKIINFAKRAIGTPDPNYLSPPYKIIILDEADSMTTEAQSALRKVMENTSSITRFCFICNYINQIIDPIASRCMKFRFGPVKENAVTQKLKTISEREKLFFSDDVIQSISKICKGDVRRSIMLLQNLKHMSKLKTINVENTYDIGNYMPPKIINELWTSCIINKNASIKDIVTKTNQIKSLGYPINNIYEQLKNKIIESDIDDKYKSLLTIQISVSERQLIEGADEYIQLLNVISYSKHIIDGVINYYPQDVC
jgi:replication factor C subunit 2/4